MRFICFIFILACTLPLSAQVIDYEIDESFNSGLLFNRGSVSDIIYTTDAKFFIMGMFSGVDSPISNGAQININGSLNDPVNIAGSFVHQYLDGFLQYGNDIRRFWTNPGQLNPNFKFEFKKPAYSGGLSNKVLDALVMPDDKILVAGRFFTDSTLIGTPIASQGLRQLCMIDSTGAPVSGFPMLRCEWPTNSVINTIHRMSTGEYIIAGSFNEVDGHPYPKLAKLNADFSVNTEFEPVFESGFGEVFTTLIDGQDRIWAIFESNVSVLNNPTYESLIARILPDGTLDTNFNAPVCTAYAGGTYENPTTPNNIAAGLIEDDDGSFILSGDFIEINGEHHRRLAKITDSGEVIEGAMQYTTPDSSVWDTYTGVFGPVMSAGIRVVKKLPDGKLLIGGQFSSFGGEPYSCLLRLQPNGFVGTNDKEGRGKLKLWPNPARTEARLHLPGSVLTRATLHDMQGREVLSTSLHYIEPVIDVSTLASGMYLLRALDSDGGVYIEKMIVE